MKVFRLFIILILSVATLFSCMTYDVHEEPASEPEDLTPSCDIQNAYALLAGCISRDGRLLYISGHQRSSSHNRVFIIDLQRLSIIERLQADDDLIFTLALSPNEHQLATGGRGKNLRIWDTDSWEQILKIDSTEVISSAVYDHRGWSLFFTGPNNMPYELLSFYPQIETKPLSENTNIVFDDALFILKANPADGYLATGGEYGKLSYWQTSESNEKNEILWEYKNPDGDILGLEFSNDGNLLFSADSSGKVDVFDSLTGSIMQSLDADSDYLFWLTTDIRDKYLYAAASSGSVYVWDLKNFERVSDFRAHDDKIQTILTDPLNRFIVSAGFSNRIIFHNPETFQTIVELYMFDDALVAVTPDGFYTGDGDFEQYVYSGTNNRDMVIKKLQ